MGELIADLDKYSIYKVNNQIAGTYYLCIPSNNISSCQLYLGFSDKDIEDLANDEIISIISNVNDIILTINNGGIYIVPNVNASTLEELSTINDLKFYIRFSNELISPIISEVYSILIRNNIKKNNINQYIQIITKNDIDKNIADGLSLCPGSGPFMIEAKYYDLLNESTNKIGGTVLGAVDNSENPFIVPIMDTDVERIDNSRVSPVNHNYEENIQDKSKEKVLVRKPSKKVKNPNGLPGFSSFSLIIITLFLALIFSGIIGYMILR